VSPTGRPTNAQRFGAEIIGTFFLTFVAAGADVLDHVGGGIGHTARYLAPGLVVAAMIWSLSGISGAHLNPAVTLTFVLRGSFPPKLAGLYVVAQFAGAVAAAATVALAFGSLIDEGVTQPGTGVTPLAAVAWEGLLTALLVFVILATAEEEAVVGKNAALAVGLTVALCGLFSSHMTGASMNPARSFGPALVSGDWRYAWVYIVGPLVGGAVAAALIRPLFGPPGRSGFKAARGKNEE